jgi:uncharacterized membrane protein YidH (DUF202 family)
MSTRFLSWDIDRSNSDFYILHWKALVVMFNLRLKDTLQFNEYLLFSSFYLMVIIFCLFLFIEMRCRGYRGPHDKLRFIFDILALVGCGIIMGCSFGWTYVFIQFYRLQKYKIICLILLGIVIFIFGLLAIALTMENKSYHTHINIDGIKYGFQRYNQSSNWYVRSPQNIRDVNYLYNSYLPIDRQKPEDKILEEVARIGRLPGYVKVETENLKEQIAESKQHNFKSLVIEAFRSGLEYLPYI